VVTNRAEFGAVPSSVELGILLNRVAWAHRAAGFGLSRKVGGTVVPFPGGGTICHDVLQLLDGTAWDVLVGAGEAATPTQGESFLITDPARPWLAPVDPGESLPEPAPEPELVPAPAPVPPSVPDLTEPLAELSARVWDLEAAIGNLMLLSYPPGDCDPSEWEAAGRLFGLWSVALPLRKKT